MIFSGSDKKNDAMIAELITIYLVEITEMPQLGRATKRNECSLNEKYISMSYSFMVLNNWSP